MNNGPKVNKIVFCDSVPAIAADKDILYIALKPQVYAYLQEKGVSVKNTLPYFKNDSHEKCLKKSEILMSWIRAYSGFTDLGDGIKDAYREMLIFWLRICVHHCLWTVEIIQNAIDKYKPEAVGAVCIDKKPASSLYVESEEGFLDYLVNKAASQNSIKYMAVPSGASCVSNKSVWAALFGDLKALGIFIIRLIKFKFFELAISFRSFFSKKKAILFCAKSYQMDKFARLLKKESGDWPLYYLKYPLTINNEKYFNFVVSICGSRFSRSIKAQKNIIEALNAKIKKEAGLFSYHGISFAELMVKKIDTDLKGFILRQTFWSFLLKRHLDFIKPAMLVSNSSRSDDMLLAEMCQGNRIENTLVSHGTHVLPKNEYEKIEWGEQGRQFFRLPLSYIAMPTPVSEGFLKVFPSDARVIKTGPLIWGLPANKENSSVLFSKLFNEKYIYGKTKVVLHAGTPKASNSLRLFVYETSDEYIQALSDLAKAVEKIPDTVLIIKFRPLKEIDVNTLKSLLPFSEKVVLCINDSFSDALGMADLLVSFSSTSIDEALQNRIPVLLYGGGGRYQHILAQELIRGESVRPSAIYHLKETPDLQDSIKRILDLDIAGKYSGLFNDYIYPERIRKSIIDLLDKNCG